ncbi:hypothetical protein Acr_20g0007450 [Actinidia rufa]|uniref:Uncharacterized protein n=1 Tax=Actinidia rufa TaxID=165716 RepID=A0A7J0GDP7_9ERIC|nr:hypothetical protein Acr_20g0007450 [Actinidia rufa]
MTIEVTQYPSFPREYPSNNEGDYPDNEGSSSIDTRPLPKRETNIMTQGELDCLRESCYSSFRIQIRLPKADETITSTHPSKVAFYEAAFKAGKGEPKSTTSAVKGMVIIEKSPRDEMPNISPLKKGKQVAYAKKKGLMPPPEEKKKGPAAKAPAKSKTMSSQAAAPTAVPGEGTSANLGVDLGPNASILENPEVADKLLQGLILPADQETM